MPVVSSPCDSVNPIESVLSAVPNPPSERLIKTISRTKQGSLLYQTTSSATDMVSQGHGCQGLAPLCRRRWIYRPPITSDVTDKTASPSERAEQDDGEEGQFLIYLLLCTSLTEPVVRDIHNA